MEKERGKKWGGKIVSRVGFVCACRYCGSDEIVFVSRGEGLVRCLKCNTVGDYNVFRAKRYRMWELVDSSEPKDGGDKDG